MTVINYSGFSDGPLPKGVPEVPGSKANPESSPPPEAHQKELIVEHMEDSVTIFGNNAGSKAVNGLLLSPLGAELFSRAILQSEMLLLPQSVKEALENVAKIAAYFPGCPPEEKNPETLLSGCLRRCCAEELLNATRDSGVSLGTPQIREV
ncbi:Cocaine esterase [Tyrophagus putrescentiae]|nr:Cocaine esterase [Tyrophagus putrescentiae]